LPVLDLPVEEIYEEDEVKTIIQNPCLMIAPDLMPWEIITNFNNEISLSIKKSAGIY
jgi:hypothetical protein